MALLDTLKNLIPQNTNIFGATQPSYLNSVATADQLEAARNQSLFQGLLGMGVGYLAQPKNQGYGSAIPYLAKSYLQGMQMAQSPYQQLEKDILMKQKFDQIALEQQQKKDMLDLQNKLYVTKPAVTQTTSDYAPIAQIGPGGEAAIAPSFAPYNMQETIISPEQKVLNQQALMDYAIKYPTQGGQFVDTITKLNELNKPKTSRVLTKDEIKSGLYGNLDETGIYQISPTGAISTIQSPTKPVDYGQSANLMAVEKGYKTFNDAPENIQANIAKVLRQDKKELAQLSGGIPLTTKTEGAVQEQLFKSGERLINLNRISNAYDPSFLTYQGNIDYWALALKDKAGQLNENSPEGQWFIRASQFKQQAGKEINAYINEVTGAAIGQGEEEQRIRKGIPDPDKDGPVRYKAKLKDTITVLQMSEARARWIAKNKGLEMKDIPIIDENGKPTNDMPNIMRERAKELEKNLVPKGEKIEDRVDIQNAIKKQISQEFGILYR